MDKNQKKMIPAKAAFILTALLASACAPSVETPVITQTLPAPILRVTHAAAAPPVDTVTTSPPEKIPIPKTDIEQLADELYGQRVIRQIIIPKLGVESKVVPVGWRIQFADEIQHSEFEWDSPGADVGWVITSALPDETGNVVLYGHNNLYEKVFENLAELAEGDKIQLQTVDRDWEYQVRYVLILPVTGVGEEQVRTYRKYLQPAQDSRLTLISCWPPVSNTHRVIVIAHPILNR